MSPGSELEYELRKQLFELLLFTMARSHTKEQLHAYALQALKDVEAHISNYREFLALLEEYNDEDEDQ